MSQSYTIYNISATHMTKNIFTTAQADFRQFAVYPQVSTSPTNALTATRYGTITRSRDRNTAPGAVVINQVMDRDQIMTDSLRHKSAQCMKRKYAVRNYQNA